MSTDAGVIVVEDKRMLVFVVSMPADPDIAGAEVAGRDIVRQRGHFAWHGFAAPWPVLPVGGHDNPFFAQWVPALFPVQFFFHSSLCSAVSV